jgi:hypothetical protein
MHFAISSVPWQQIIFKINLYTIEVLLSTSEGILWTELLVRWHV